MSVMMAQLNEGAPGESAARILAAADRERRRLERDLHDGAQQRLVSLSMRLRLLRTRLAPGSEAERLLAIAQEELTASLQELRELARGLHPAVLSERGLRGALESLALRAPLPVELSVVLEDRPPAAVEVAAYYLVCEALTNIAKYANADTAIVRVARQDAELVIEVADDGVGGADPADGSGLRGLADRIEALSGRLHVWSAPATGTTVRAEIPLQDPVLDRTLPAIAPYEHRPAPDQLERG
jgi:signal transduction histidine kinase